MSEQSEQRLRSHAMALPGRTTAALIDRTSDIPLLDAAVERNYAAQVQAGLEGQRQLSALATRLGSRQNVPDTDDVQALVRSVLAGRTARTELVFYGLPLAVWAARLSVGDEQLELPLPWVAARLRGLARFSRDRLPLEDRMQAAVAGLLAAVGHFRPDGGARFFTYAAPTVRREIAQAVLAERYRDGLSPSTATELEATLAARSQLHYQMGYEPGVGLIASNLDWGMEAVESRLQEAAAYPLYSLEELEVEPDRLWAAQLRDQPDELISAVADQQDRAARVRRALQRLDAQQFGVMCRRYGLGAVPPQSRQEIAEADGLTVSRVGQIERASLALLRACPELAAYEGSLEEEPAWSWYGVHETPEL